MRFFKPAGQTAAEKHFRGVSLYVCSHTDENRPVAAG